jgi:repressor LexA
MKPPHTSRQGQFLAFIHHYTILHGRPPAEAEMARFFRVTPPSVHLMIRPWNGTG